MYCHFIINIINNILMIAMFYSCYYKTKMFVHVYVSFISLWHILVINLDLSVHTQVELLHLCG